MEITKVSDSGGANEIETLRAKNLERRCIYYKEEQCSAPRLCFEICRTCYRINPQFAIRSFIEKIKFMAIELLKLQPPEPGRFPPEPPAPGEAHRR